MGTISNKKQNVMKEGWFLTELIYRIHHQNNKNVYQFDKQMKMIKSGSIREAYQFSLVLASKELDDRNGTNKDEQWEFAGIGMFQTIDEPAAVKGYLTFQYAMSNENDARAHMTSLRARMENLQMEIALSA
jgi:hypothetical protein